MSIKRHLFLTSALAFSMALFGLSACSPTVDIRGRIPEPELLAQVKVGQSSEDDVQTLLGSPSSTTVWGNQIWHYIYERTETVSFLTPVVKEYKAVSIVFDDQGKVAKIEKLNGKKIKDVDLVTRETPTAGKEMTVVEQLLGNVGKFAKEDKPK